MSECIFCDILESKVESSIVYADDDVIAFMDIQPVNAGHVPVVPNQHAAYLADLDAEIGGNMFKVAQRIAAAIRQSDIRCEAVNLFLADGEAAGQDVFHVHLHVIPRYENDGFGLTFGPEYKNLPRRSVLNEIAGKIEKGMVPK